MTLENEIEWEAWIDKADIEGVVANLLFNGVHFNGDCTADMLAEAIRKLLKGSDGS